jgi:DNA repair protein RecN (Recombination protein N)
MLTNLRIEHFAIVSFLELDFIEGLNAFTGETGAGKSIMIDALMLALGGRADTSVIRPGESRCDITARFQCDEDSEPSQWLARHDVLIDDGELYLRRIVTSDGRSKSTINGQPFPLHKIKELSEQLVHIHGQHQHQTLMQHQTHRQQLDHYAGHQNLLNEVSACYKKAQEIQREIDQINHQEQQADRMKLLQFQIDELSELNITEGELEALHQEHQILHHAKEYLGLSQEINELINSDSQPDICSGLHQALHILSQLPKEHASIKACNELIHTAVIQCEEALGEMQRFADKIQIDPSRLNEVELRMSAIHQFARKHHINSNHLVAHKEALQQELDTLLGSKSQLAHLQLHQAQILKSYEALAQKLRASRQLHAPKLAEEITASIQQLGMPKGWVHIECAALDSIHAHGIDKIEYKICTNPGMAPDSLGKIASGGELSRISLAIQLITAQRGSTPTLLFDEVDVGIGGATAALVGKMLRQLGERLQVFCVTHQPQVAAAAHHHYLVQKHSQNEQTYTDMSLLDTTRTVDEIARMLGGITVTEHTLLHAKELLAQSSCPSL